MLYNISMVILAKLQEKFARDEFEFSKHAVDQTILREISVQEIRNAIIDGEIIEDYPDDKYGPSCLVLGFTNTGRPLHIHCSHPTRSLIKIVTVYEPDSDLWNDFRFRKER